MQHAFAQPDIGFLTGDGVLPLSLTEEAEAETHTGSPTAPSSKTVPESSHGPFMSGAL